MARAGRGALVSDTAKSGALYGRRVSVSPAGSSTCMVNWWRWRFKTAIRVVWAMLSRGEAFRADASIRRLTQNERNTIASRDDDVMAKL